MEENLLLQAPHSNVHFRLRLFRSQEHSIPILNGSEMEKIKTWHLGFVIAMETIGFFMTSLPLQDLSKRQSVISQHDFATSFYLHTEVVHGGCMKYMKQKKFKLSAIYDSFSTLLSSSLAVTESSMW